MGNHRLRLSDMMPNALFCKLKYMSQPQRSQPTKNTTKPPSPAPKHQLQPLVPNRASSYVPSSSPLHPKAFDTHFPLDSPRKSTPLLQKPRRIPAIVTSSSSTTTTTSSSSSSSLSVSSSCRGSVSDSDSDVVQSYRITKNSLLGLDLPPIITKPKTGNTVTVTVTAKPNKAAPAIRRLRMRTSASPRTRIRTSPSAEKARAVDRKSGLSESFAVVKSTSDPRSDFRESMTEMILENGLRSSGELEELLACYLSLNSNEYHHVIVDVFEEIWLDISTDLELSASGRRNDI